MQIIYKKSHRRYPLIAKRGIHMRDVIPRKQQTHTRIETEAVIRLHREPTNGKKNEENRTRACVCKK